jgi:hypothetical protein
MEVSQKSPRMTPEHQASCKLIDGLMERQDEVLIQLDQLNASIESMIKEMTAWRSQDAGEHVTIPVDESVDSTRIKRIAA